MPRNAFIRGPRRDDTRDGTGTVPYNLIALSMTEIEGDEVNLIQVEEINKHGY